MLVEGNTHFKELPVALVTMLGLAHHPSYVHVHFVIDLGREIAIVHRVSAVAQPSMLGEFYFITQELVSISFFLYFYIAVLK